jgi:hypothetical protein
LAIANIGERPLSGLDAAKEFGVRFDEAGGAVAQLVIEKHNQIRMATLDTGNRMIDVNSQNALSCQRRIGD